VTGWAATNTLREHLPTDYLGPDRNDMDGERWGQQPEALAALALVEAALDAAARAEDALRIHGRGVELIGARVDLAAALRAVREGK